MMQETTLKDGRKLRQFFFAEDEDRLRAHATRLHAEALADPRVLEIRQRFGIGRNKPCPCGSGKKFKNCCERNALPVDA